MEERIPMTNFARQWAEQIRKQRSLRMRDDAPERVFQRDFIRNRPYGPDSSPQKVMGYLRPLFQEYKIESVLEFGPGRGNYTVEIANLCQEITCVDLSQDVLDFILQVCCTHGVHNLRTHCAKWEDFAPDRTYDLVFGYNCFYRQADLPDCFRRMTHAANKLCIAGMNTASKPRWMQELQAAGAKVEWDWKDYFYFVGVLYQMGIDPNLRVIPFNKVLKYSDVDALVRGECAYCDPTTVDPRKAREILCRHFSYTPGGGWSAVLHCHSGIVWWTTQQ